MEKKIERLANLIRESTYAVALTGAGVSTESGIPDFRSADSGLWNVYDFAKVASVEGFLNDTAGFYEFWKWRFARLNSAKPNMTHKTLAKLERLGHLKALITQNIDNLHREAGSEAIYEVHGNYRTGLCIDCREELPIEEIFSKVETSKIPACDGCGGLLKPNVVLFGEFLPPAFIEGMYEALKSDLLIVLGSSLEVYPVADLVPQAKMNGARIVVVNRDETPFDRHLDLVIHSELGAAMQALNEIID